MKKKLQNVLLLMCVAIPFLVMAYSTIIDENYTKVGNEYVVNTPIPTWTPTPTDFEVLVNVFAEPKLDGDSLFLWSDLYVEIEEDAPYYEAGSIWQLRFPQSMMPALMKDWVDSKGKLVLILICNKPLVTDFRMSCKNEYRKASE